MMCSTDARVILGGGLYQIWAARAGFGGFRHVRPSWGSTRPNMGSPESFAWFDQVWVRPLASFRPTWGRARPHVRLLRRQPGWVRACAGWCPTLGWFVERACERFARPVFVLQLSCLVPFASCVFDASVLCLVLVLLVLVRLFSFVSARVLVAILAHGPLSPTP